MDNHRQDRYCTSFCQIRTYFEWSEKRSFPHSECHYTIKCGMTESESTSWSYRWGGTGKVQYEKALNIGITGSYSCEEGAEHIGNYCAYQMWNIKHNGKQVPDGVIIFVWTNYLTRQALPMDKQDPAYRVPGVALDYLDKDGKRRLFMRGSGFRDDMIGTNGEKLFEGVKKCTQNKMEDASCGRYYNGYPSDSPKVQGATWLFKADVLEKSGPDCFGRHLMLMGAVTQDKCQWASSFDYGNTSFTSQARAHKSNHGASGQELKMFIGLWGKVLMNTKASNYAYPDEVASYDEPWCHY
ncbi:hypothetical protein CGCSCA4_v007188 [Colletotrichum siamense]|uniref:Uncharacterized protein n=1 Tax=Colletotrichum siamense TaxID=690259 RepID=A0A9P5K5Y2_COLSI|nr:hypothetical protein CGCSCA4_v007188 [Colletotrichum siamense]KAF4859947.1 hypothetical protein CGCSCA2_v005753 [Colletotrichum siamense]